MQPTGVLSVGGFFRTLLDGQARVDVPGRNPLNVPTQLSSAALTRVVPARLVPLTWLFQVLAPHADHVWPGMMVMAPMNRSVNGPLALMFKSSLVGLKTWIPTTLVS